MQALCPARTKIPDSRRRAGAQRNCLCKQCKPREPLLSGTVETILKFKFPDASQPGLSKDSGLRLAEFKLPAQEPEMGDLGKVGLDYEKYIR